MTITISALNLNIWERTQYIRRCTSTTESFFNIQEIYTTNLLTFVPFLLEHFKSSLIGYTLLAIPERTMYEKNTNCLKTIYIPTFCIWLIYFSVASQVEQVRKTGTKLMNLCGEPDKPEVKKHIEDLDSAWDNITALYARREENLIDAMEKAMEFHETLQVWCSIKKWKGLPNLTVFVVPPFYNTFSMP